MKPIRRIKNWLTNIGAKPASKPAPSVFGANAKRRQQNIDRDQDYDMQVAIEKGRPRGF